MNSFLLIMNDEPVQKLGFPEINLLSKWSLLCDIQAASVLQKNPIILKPAASA